MVVGCQERIHRPGVERARETNDFCLKSCSISHCNQVQQLSSYDIHIIKYNMVPM